MQVIYGVVTTSPHDRTAEHAIRDGILHWAALVGLTPATGVPGEVVEEWAGKMAYAAKNLVVAFKKVWKESPLASKCKTLDSLKKRVNEAVVLSSEEAPISPPANSPLPSPSATLASSVELVQKTFRGFQGLEEALESLEVEESQEVSVSVSTATPTSKPSLSPSPDSTVGEAPSARMEMPPWVTLL